MVQQKERENIRSMLTDTVKLLVKNGLTFKHKFNIDGLLGITVDDGDVFLVPMSELVKSDNVHGISLELEVEESHTRTKSPDISSPTSTRSRPGQRVRKRQRMNTRNTGSSRDAGSSDDENGDDFSQGDVSEIPEGTPGKPDSVDASNVNDVSESLPKNISIKREIDEEAWMQEQQSYPDLSDDQSADRSSFLDPAYSATPVTGVYRHPGMDNMPGTSGTQNMDEEELAISGMPKVSTCRSNSPCGREVTFRAYCKLAQECWALSCYQWRIKHGIHALVNSYSEANLRAILFARVFVILNYPYTCTTNFICNSGDKINGKFWC